MLSLNTTEAASSNGRVSSPVWASPFYPEGFFSGDFYFSGARYEQEFPRQPGCQGTGLGDQLPPVQTPFGGLRDRARHTMGPCISGGRGRLGAGG